MYMESKVFRKNFFLTAIILLAASLPVDVMASRGGSSSQAEEPPKIYTERARQLMDRLAADLALPSNQPLTKEEQAEFAEMMRNRDSFMYDPSQELRVTNKSLPLNVRQPGISVIKLGHTFTTTLVFTDSAGNPWNVDLLTDVSDSDVVSVSKKAPHIISVRPLKKAGKTNLPIKLRGEQRPLTFLFDISNKEVYFNVDVQIEALGDHVDSQQIRSLSQYRSDERVSARLTPEPAKDMMLQFLTPEGYQEHRLYNEYGEEVDDRDFVAWSKGNKLYVLTPHDAFTPDPVDIYASPDGRHTLFEYPLIPVVSMRKDSKIFMLYLR
jgi:hypothetical protein